MGVRSWTISCTGICVVAGPKVLSDILAIHSLHAWLEKGNRLVLFELISKRIKIMKFCYIVAFQLYLCHLDINV
jgi:hypothetical protein